jgi:hypothetical protein
MLVHGKTQPKNAVIFKLMNKKVKKVILLSCIASAVIVASFFLTVQFIDTQSFSDEDTITKTMEKQKEIYERSSISTQEVLQEIENNSIQKNDSTYLFLEGSRKSDNPYTNPNYSIEYYKEVDPETEKIYRFIRIFILQPPFEENREKAEEAFLEALSIQKKQVCELPVTLGTTFDVSPQYAGRNFSLSFCE